MIKAEVAKKELLRNKAKNAVLNIGELVFDEPLILLPVAMAGIAMVPVFKLQDNSVKKHITKNYGCISTSLDSLGNPKDDKEYIWNLHTAFMYNLNNIKLHSKRYVESYILNTGYIDILDVCDQLRKFTNDENYLYFIKTNLSLMLRIDDKKILSDVIDIARKGNTGKAMFILNKNR